MFQELRREREQEPESESDGEDSGDDRYVDKGTSRQLSGKGAIRKKFPLKKLRWEKLN